MIFDTHAHYDDEAFDADREEVLRDFPEKGIAGVINVGASLASTKSTLALAHRYPYMYAAVGVHPDGTPEMTEKAYAWLKQQCSDEKAVAVGEIGLDYYWPEPDRGTQRYWFRRQLRLAREVELPLIIHSREAAKDTITMLREEQSRDVGGVIHCYSYSTEMAREFLELGFVIGIGGVLTFKNAKKLREVVEYVPLDSILLETDCPYMAPVPYRGKRNCSLYLPQVVEAIAEIKGITTEKVEEITLKNAHRIFLDRRNQI